MKKSVYCVVTVCLSPCALTVAPRLCFAELMLPVISIGSATGSVTWNVPSPVFGATLDVFAGLSGPGFSLNFFDLYPDNAGLDAPYFFTVAPTVSPTGGLVVNVPGNLNISSVINGAGIYPSGSLNVGNTTYNVAWCGGSGISVSALGSTTIPYTATPSSFVVPAVLTGSVLALSTNVPPSQTTPLCAQTPPTYVANVDFNVPGLMTIYLGVTGSQVFRESTDFAVAFTPIPEPTTTLPSFIAFALIAIAARLQKSRDSVRGVCKIACKKAPG